MRAAILLTLLVVVAGAEDTRYLAFQIFTSAPDSAEMRRSIPPASESLQQTVDEIRAKVGTTGSAGRRMGFIAGPVAFDNSDEEVRELIARAFEIALRSDVAVGFHIDDSMLWGRLKQLNSAKNLEWLDWGGTVNTGRRLDWSLKPLKVAPQLCLNSADVTAQVKQRAGLIGEAVRQGMAKLHAAQRDELFLGVIAGWESQIGYDADTGKALGYCALSNLGFSAAHPPPDFEQARGEVVRSFVALWAKQLANAGVPADKIYSHIAFLSEAQYRLAQRVNPGHTEATYLQAVNATPPEIAFTDFTHPGFSTYPQPGHLDQLRAALKAHGNPPWASSEGTAIAPDAAEMGGAGRSMEGYLGNLFNHGARVVNLFGWGVGEASNPFRRAVEGRVAIAAYRKFLQSEVLAEDPLPGREIPSVELPEKMRLIQQHLPGYVEKNGPARVSELMQQLTQQMKQQKFAAAEKTAEQVLQLIR